ncbi:MAG: CPBP family intramembrane glutamic endopeptidase, partial [Myxococcota bacterium]|nr:CPBP family intramembrane glutamic endopeptidase [Myxococcota bacterium]
YMQTRLDGLFNPKRFSLLGAKFGWSLPITALLFTVGHSLVTLQWWQPFIFFPALVFGWMRARSGNILAGAMFHAWANTIMIVLDHIYGLPGSRLEETGWTDLWGDLTSIFEWFGGLF